MLRTLVIAVALSSSPKAAVRIAAASDGAEWAVPFLDRVASIESRGRPIGLHERDAHHGRRMWARAERAGWLEPDRCEGHRDRNAGWSPRGSWGLAPAYSHRWLGEVGCVYGPELHDVPIFAAVAVVRHVKYISRKYKTRDPAKLRLLWAGKKKRREDVLARWRGR